MNRIPEGAPKGQKEQMRFREAIKRDIRADLCSGGMIHVVVADIAADDESIVITVYEPDPAQRESDFKKRRQR